MAKTISTFRTELMNEFGLAEDNQNEGTSADAVLKYIIEANASFINHRAWTYRIKRKTFIIYEDTTVKTTFTTAASSCDLNSTVNWGSSGRFLCDGDIIEFTANDSVDTLTITTADIDRTHQASERCLLLYEVPSDYNKVCEVKVNDTTYFKEDARNLREPSPGRFWELVVNLTNGDVKRYFAFPYHTSQQTIYMTYAQKGMSVPADPDTAYMEVPEPYWNYVYHIVAARIYRHLEEHSTAELHEQKAEKLLKKASVFDSKQHMGLKTPIRTAWDNPAAKMGITTRYNNFHRNN